MKRYTSLIVLAALFGLALTQDTAAETPATNDNFLDTEKDRFKKDAAKAACYIYKDLTYWDITSTVSKNSTGYPVDNVVELTKPSAISKYGGNAELHYNLCAYTQEQCNGENVFAYITSSS